MRDDSLQGRVYVIPARIISRTEVRLSPWVCVVNKEVELIPGRQAEAYHCLSQPASIVILARTYSGLIPVVKQYRPAVEAYTLELPAGLLEDGESPEDGCRRELKEETGLEATVVRHLGSYYPDTGRLENRFHAFFVLASDPNPAFVSEPGISVEFVDARTLGGYVLSGTLQDGQSLGLLGAAYIAGISLDGGSDIEQKDPPGV
jgi:ADP-ribose pyrophosphatase